MNEIKISLQSRKDIVKGEITNNANTVAEINNLSKEELVEILEQITKTI